MGVRLRLYGCERMRRERILGEAIVSFAKINLELENHFWLNLLPRANASVSIYTYIYFLINNHMRNLISITHMRFFMN